MGTIVTSGRSGGYATTFGRRVALGAGLAGLAALAGLGGLVGLGAGEAQAAQIARFSPEGVVPQVRQVAIRFDEPMVPMGDLNAAPPAAVSCTGGAAAGSGRWVNATNWVFDFERDLPPGMRCTVRISSGLKSVAGKAYTGKPEYRFETGGPTVVSARPSGGQVEEDQVFVLRFNGAATAGSIREHAWCQAEGLGERIPVRLLAGKERTDVIAAVGWNEIAKREGEAVHLLACQQKLPAGARMQLVLDAGIATPSGIATTAPRRFDYTVREAFAAGFTCERERAEAPCTPLRPMTVTFTAPIPRKVAEHIVLKTPSGPRAPTFDPDQPPDAPVESVRFTAPFPERASLTIEAPRDIKDDSGRPLTNADLFPIKLTTGALPPLAKFAAAPFGVVERFADVPRGKSPADYPPLLPVTLRNVEADLPATSVRAEAGTVARLKVDDDTAILRWFGMVKRMHENTWTKEQIDAIRAGKPPYAVRSPRNAPAIETRAVPLLRGVAGAQTLAIPKSSDTSPRPFEVVGIPLPEPGFHVVEIASPMLGAALLGKSEPMYVRTAALVTNLGVHFKLARGTADGEMSGLAWVTGLDDGKPVANARIAVRSCDGALLGEGTTDATGVARFAKLPDQRYQDCGNGMDGYFVSARIAADHPKARGKADMAFVMSNWNRGIETWRFNVPTDMSPKQTVRAHTIFDRTLLRLGETVSMKHLLRSETAQGFALPASMPEKAVVTHDGSGQTYELPLAWRTTATGGRSAESTFQIPQAAKLGVYSVGLVYADGRTLDGGTFRVEAFRLPVLAGTLSTAKDPKAKGSALVAPAEVPVGVEIHYLNGGGAAGLPVRLSALLREKPVNFADFDEFSFQPPRAQDERATVDDEDSEDTSGESREKLVADKLPVTLDKDGNGKVTVKDMPKITTPGDLVLEAGFADPNGEIQTLRQTVPVWPSAVVAGIRAANWVSVSQKLSVQGVVLDTQGKPVADTPVQVKARARITTSARQRVVGGFYRYDNRTESKDLGVVCESRTDAQGRMRCDVSLAQAGQVELIANARDADGRVSQASTTVWVTRQGELWFGGENHDRMDVLPEKRAYAPGDTAVFQVRMPFRHATALVAIEREGILETQVVELNGTDPTVRLKVKPEWGPNVYVSVLSVRGRLRDVPWYSFFTWGWRQPVDWWRAFRSEGRDYVAPSPLVDLSKPAFRLGLAEIRVGNEAHRLDVSVTPDKATYPVRGKARVTVQVKLPDGKPAANGEVALAAVDQALLELMPNTSWNLLDAMLQRRSYGVETSTAQMEIIGRRHYGRKAVPAGGGGGKSPTRELFDTLLLWNPRVQLDAEGRATLDVPLNDSLTSFRIVAVADLGVGRFGTGSATVAATQDLQMISGLPLLVREDDKYRAMFTLRNTTQRAMTVETTARATLVDAQTLPAQTVELPAGASREIGWDVTAPALLAYSRSGTVMWEVAATEKGGTNPAQAAADRLKLSQQIVPAVPVTAQQAMLAQMAPTVSVPVQAPAGALTDPSGKLRGGMQVTMQSSLAGGMPGVREWFRHYPYSCLEQRTSKSLGLGDTAAWDALMAQLPSYLDSNGLAAYFPLQSDASAGSEVLTAYLLSVADEAARAGLPMRLPEAQRAQMERGLTSFVEGRITPPRWAPASASMDLDVRKLAALEALSRTGHAQARMLGSIQILPAQWPTSALIDWLALLSRVTDIPEHDKRLAEAQQLLRSRLTVQGTRLVFSTERSDDWWWLMANGDVNAAKLLALATQLPGWKDDVPQLVTGLLGRQTRGAWGTTTANAWGVLAVQRYAQVFEKTPVAGGARVTLGDASRTFDWSGATKKDGVASGAVDLPWPAAGTTGTLQVEQQGAGRPWATVRAMAAVPLREPVAAGYRIKRTVTPVEQAVAGKWSRGDSYRVRLEIDAQADMTWVVVNDPVPTGATILGSGLGRDSQIATSGEKKSWATFAERTPESYREYFGYLPKGNVAVEYTVRLNNAGEFALPPTRVEALYAPDVFGAAPNAKVTVGARP